MIHIQQQQQRQQQQAHTAIPPEASTMVQVIAIQSITIMSPDLTSACVWAVLAPKTIGERGVPG